MDQGVYVKDLSMFVLKSVTEIEHVFNVGSKNRSVGATQMNQDSSRSHSIFTIVVESSAPGADGENHLKMGKLHLVDLAGSERSSKTGATGSRALEGIKINLSLTALGNVISCLVRVYTVFVLCLYCFTPFRAVFVLFSCCFRAKNDEFDRLMARARTSRTVIQS